MKRGQLARFCHAKSGATGLVFGLVTPLLFGLVAAAVDYSTWAAQKDVLQSAADSAVLALGRELQLGNPTDARIQAIAEGLVDARVKPEYKQNPLLVTATPIRPGGSTDPQVPPTSVRITISQRKDAILSQLVTPALTDIEVVSGALMAGMRVCVIGLEGMAPDAIRLDDSAQIVAPNCSVSANSVSPSALRAEKSSKITGLRICTGGGYLGMGTNYAPAAPMTDCPKTPDPLAERPQPSSDPCPVNAKGLKVKKKTTSLNPGTYCGGLYIEKGADVVLNPGIYVIKNGPLVIGPGRPGDDNADEGQDLDDDGTPASRGSVRGNGVGFYFTGTLKENRKKALVGMRFEPNSVVELTAPISGPMAGLLFSEDQANSLERRYEILSDQARRLVGTIYLPRGVFEVSANQTVADLSEYTAIVAKRIELFQSPRLVLNTRYGDTNVPVPEGLGPNSGASRLQ
jgi:hypothetical protein